METLTIALQFLRNAMTCNHGAMRTINRRRELCHFHYRCDLRAAIRSDRPSGKEKLRKSTRKVFIPLTRTFVSRRKLPRLSALSPAKRRKTELRMANPKWRGRQRESVWKAGDCCCRCSLFAVDESEPDQETGETAEVSEFWALRKYCKDHRLRVTVVTSS